MKKYLIITLIGLFIVFNLSVVSSEGETPVVTESLDGGSVTSCLNGVCTLELRSRPLKAQDSSGEWVNISEVIGISKFQDDLTFWYDGINGSYNITFEAGVIYNGNYYSFSQIKSFYPVIEFSFPVTKNIDNKKYSVIIDNIDETPLTPSLFESITLTYKSHEGFTIDQLKTKQGKFIIKELFGLGFNDAKSQGYTINLNLTEKRVYINNLGAGYSNGTLEIDPTITLQTANTENLEDSYVDSSDTYGNFGTDTEIYLNGRTSTPIKNGALKFAIDDIPANQTIENASLCLEVIANYLDSGESVSVTAHRIYPYPTYSISGAAWLETNIMWYYAPDNTEHNTTAGGSATISYGETGWTCWNVTKIISQCYAAAEDDCSIYLKGAGAVSGSPSSLDQVLYHSKEHSTSANRPKLTIGYENITDETDSCSCPGAGVAWEIDLSDNCDITDACDITTAGITFTGTGSITFDASIKACTIGALPAGETGYIGSSAAIEIGGGCS